METLGVLTRSMCFTRSNFKTFRICQLHQYMSKNFTTGCKYQSNVVKLLKNVVEEPYHPHCRHKTSVSQQADWVRKSPPWRIMFLGTDEFALPHLKALNENRLSTVNRVVDSIQVVVPKDARSPVCDYAIAEGLDYYRWPIPTMSNTFDVGVVTSFGHLIPRRIIDMFPYGILNVHPSLLPRWRGASPILHTILNGDHITGITIIEIRPIHFDIGPILVQQSYPVPPRCTTNELLDMLSGEGSRLLIETLADLLTLEKLEHEQPEEGVSYAHVLKLQNAFINWDLQTAVEIDRQYRALSDMFGIRSIWRGSVIRLRDMLSPSEMQDILVELNMKYPQDKVCPRQGLPYYHKLSAVLCVRCKSGWVGFRNVTYKKPMTALAFYNGYLSKSRSVGKVFQSEQNNLDKYAFRTAVAQPKLISIARSGAY